MQHNSLLLGHLSHTLAPGDGFLIAGVSETAPGCALARVTETMFSGIAAPGLGERRRWRCFPGKRRR